MTAEIKTTTVYRYAIVSPLGEILWNGTLELNQKTPAPAAEGEMLKRAFWEARVAELARLSAPAEAPAGRAVILAVLAV